MADPITHYSRNMDSIDILNLLSVEYKCTRLFMYIYR